MLNHKYRFHSRGGVQATYKNGKTIRLPELSMVTAKNLKGGRRFAVVVSKKVEKSAVERNRIRRRLYEAIRLELPNFAKPTDNIFVVHSNTLSELDFLKLREIVKAFARKI